MVSSRISQFRLVTGVKNMFTGKHYMQEIWDLSLSVIGGHGYLGHTGCGVENISQIKMWSLLHTKWWAAEGWDSVYIHGLSDAKNQANARWSTLDRNEHSGSAWGGTWGDRNWGYWNVSEMTNYFICSEILDEWGRVCLLIFFAFPLFVESSRYLIYCRNGK